MKLRNICLKLIVCLIIIYLAWQLVYSNKGMISLFKLSREKQTLMNENKILEKEKNSLEKKVNRMKSKSLDLDTLDEQARKNLGYSKGNEIIYVE